MRLLRTVLVASVLLLAGIGLASGSFSVEFTPLDLHLEANLEQEVTRVSGWTVYAGSGIAVSPAGVDKLQPYGMACRGFDAFLAYAEACLELRAPIIGQGEIMRVFFSAVW